MGISTHNSCLINHKRQTKTHNKAGVLDDELNAASDKTHATILTWPAVPPSSSDSISTRICMRQNNAPVIKDFQG